MATEDRIVEARPAVTRTEGKIRTRRLSRLARAAPLAVLCVAALLASPAEARKKKKKPVEAAPVTAPAETPAEKTEPAPAAKPAAQPAKEQAEDEVDGPSLAVVGLSLDPQGARDAALAQYLGEQSVRRAKKQKLVPLEDALDPDGAAAREKAATDADRAFTAAKKAYFQDLDLEVAGALCEKAAANYAKSDLPRHFNKLIEATELKIAALAADPKQASKVNAELAALLPIDPRTELSPNLFNPDTIKQAENLRAKLKDEATLSLQVKTGSVPARVFVDGAFRGISPVKVEHLAPGQHLLTLAAPGYARVQKKVAADAGSVDEALEPASKLASVQPKLDALKRTFRSETLQTSMADLAKALGSDQLLVLAAQPGPKPPSREIAAVRAKSPPPTILDDLDAPLPADDAKAASAIDSLATEAISRDHDLKGHRLLLASGGGSSTMRYAGFGLIGGGAVAAGLGTFFGLQAKSQQSKFRSLAQTDPTASSVSSSGKTDALIANVAFGAAAVAVGTGVALVVMNRGGGEPGESSEAEAPPPPREEKRAAPRVEKKLEKKPEPKAEKKPEPKPEPRVEKKPEPKPEPKVEKKPEPRPEPKPEPKVEKKPAPEQPEEKPEATKPEQKPDEKKSQKKPEEEKKPEENTPKKPPKDLGEDIRD